MKKITTLVLSIGLCLGTMIPSFAVERNYTPEEIAQYEELAQKAYEHNQDVIIDLEKNENEQLKEMFNNTAEGFAILSSPISVTLGTDKTLTTADDGNCDGTGGMIGGYDADYSLSDRKAKSKAWTIAYGTADSFAYVGQRFTVSGSGSQTADIIFKGDYEGRLIGGVGGSATGTVKIKLWDATDSVWVDQETVRSGSSTNNIGVDLTGNISHVLSNVLLKANHEYFPYIHVTTVATQYGPQGSSADMYDSPRCAQYDSIKVDF